VSVTPDGSPVVLYQRLSPGDDPRIVDVHLAPASTDTVRAAS
jgi:(2Fe-2S) ferredoxin